MTSESPYEKFSNRHPFYEHEKQNAYDSGKYGCNINEGTEIDVIIDMSEEVSLLDECENFSHKNFLKNKILDKKFGENNMNLNYYSAKIEESHPESNFYDKYPLISSNPDNYYENYSSEIPNTPNRKTRIIDDEYGPNNFLNKKHDRSDRNEKESYDKKSEILRNLKKSANVNSKHHSPVVVSTFLNSPNTKPKSDLQNLINKTKIHPKKSIEDKNSFKRKFISPQETICLDEESQEEKLPDKVMNQSSSGPVNSFHQISQEKENILVERLKILEDKLEKLEKDREKDKEYASKSLQEISYKESNTNVINYSNTNNTLIKLFGAAMKLIIQIDETVNTKLDLKYEKCQKLIQPENEKEQSGKEIESSQDTEKFFTNKLYSTDKIDPPQIAEIVNSLYKSSYNSNFENDTNFVYSSPTFTSPLKESNYKEKSFNSNHHKSIKNKNDCYSKNQSSNMYKKSNITSPTNEDLKTTLPPCMLAGIQIPTNNNTSLDKGKSHNFQKLKCYNCGQFGHKASFCYAPKN